MVAVGRGTAGHWFVDDCFGAEDCQWGGIEIKVTVEFGVSGSPRVDSRLSQEVQLDVGLFQKGTPQVRWKVTVSTMQDRNEVFFVSSDRPFSEVLAVVVGSGNLVFVVVCFDRCKEFRIDFVVKTMKDWGVILPAWSSW